MDISAYFSNKSEDERKMLVLLRHTRMGYEEERILHNFLLDAYVGGGGFQNGLIPAPDAPFWGRRAYERGRSIWLETRGDYMRTSTEKPRRAQQSASSYLVAFSGEDQDAYRDRIMCASYHNPVEKIVRVTNSLLFQQEPQRQNLPLALSRWLDAADSRQRSMSHSMRNTALRTQIFGWSGVLVDSPSEEQNTEPSHDLFGEERLPYIVPLCPQEILDWDLEPNGEVLGLKTSTMHEHPRKSMFDEKLFEEHITYLYPDRWEKYVILMPPPRMCSGQGYFEPDAGRIIAESKGINYHGRVPVEFCSWDEGFGSVASSGLPQVYNIAKVAWDLFQQNSELRNIMRGQTFSQLVVPGTGVPKGQVQAGIGNALQETGETKGITRYITPDPAAASVYEKRMEGTTEMLHAISGLDLNSRRYTETAEAMRIRFQQTASMLQNAAKNLEHCERNLIVMAGRAMSYKDAVLQAISVQRSKTFDVDRYSTQIDEALKALTIPWGPEAIKAIWKRTIRSAVSNATEADIARLDAEIDETVRTSYDSIHAAALASVPAAAPAQ